MDTADYPIELHYKYTMLVKDTGIPKQYTIHIMSLCKNGSTTVSLGLVA